jgi:hypothetical protein
VTTDDLERDIRQVTAGWAFIRWISTEDKTDHSLKMRLSVTGDCFIQVYANIQKQLWSYALVLHRTRVFGRDCEGGHWHRHPHGAPNDHDSSPEGMRPISLPQFLVEAQQILEAEGIL